MHPYAFLLDTYSTERLKTLSVWSHFNQSDLGFRPEPRARTPLEQMVHQCVSEEAWMRGMLGIDAGLPPLPANEDRVGFLEHQSVEALLTAAREGERESSALPDPGRAPPTERPGRH